MMAGGGGAEDREGVEFKLSPSTLMKILRGNIAQWSIDGSSDAIVTIYIFFLSCMHIYIPILTICDLVLCNISNIYTTR